MEKKKDLIKIKFEDNKVYVSSNNGMTWLVSEWDKLSEIERMLLRGLSRTDKCEFETGIISWDSYSTED